MNYSKYIGLPYKDLGRKEDGIDCWGLVRLFYKNELQIDLPSYDTLYTSGSSPEVPELLAKYKESWIHSTTGVPGDVCIFNIYGEPSHVGIYVGDNKFLHAREGKDSVIDSLDSPQWSKRFQGFYKYCNDTIQVPVVGAPHPLLASTVSDWTAAGTTVQDLANYIKQKYNISARLASRTIISIDGIPVPKDKWDTTVLLEGQKVTYKTLAEGGNTKRLLLTLAVVVVSGMLGQWAVGAQGVQAMAAGTASFGTYATYLGTVMAANAVGLALVNAIAPIRVPGDPGTSKALNLFSGSSNQVNRFGSIPVVLGKVRITGVHGATPYVDTLPDTTLLNMLIVWGFGPLSVEDIRVGINAIENYYDKEFAQNIPQPETLNGYQVEDTTKFDKIYNTDIEQVINQVQLVNNTTDGNPWQNMVLSNPATELAITFACPEGMRQIVTKGDGAGNINTAQAAVEIQLRKYDSEPGDSEDWQPTNNYFLGAYNGSGTLYGNDFTKVFTDVSINLNGNNIKLTKQYAICLLPGGGIVCLEGAASDNGLNDPSAELQTAYSTGNYGYLLGTDKIYSAKPIIPPAYIKLYGFAMYNGAYVEGSRSNIPDKYDVNGLVLTLYSLIDNSIQYGTKITVTAGTITNKESTIQPEPGTEVEIFNSLAMVTGNNEHTTSGNWCDFLNTYGVWNPLSDVMFSSSVDSVHFPYTGYYLIEGSADNYGTMFINNKQVLEIPNDGYASTVSNLVYLDEGYYSVRLSATNTGGPRGIACRVTYQVDGGLNNTPNSSTVLVFGAPGFYNKRKDAFNFVYRLKDLPRNRYEIRVRRTNSDTAEIVEGDTNAHNYFRVDLFSLTGYDLEKDPDGIPRTPIKVLPNNTKLAKTAIRIQSTNKANGNLDGINAVVQTIYKTWDVNTNTWLPKRATSNPASLFLYVLTHPANAYRILESELPSKVNLSAIQEWYTFCENHNPPLEFNSVITNTQSILDILKDICAAGLASPNYVDGKWTIIVDKPRAYPTQYFTPHNSWGFESTKILPRLPHAFRVSFNNRDKAYQADETIIYNYGYNVDNATIFEELNLPGVTNKPQAEFLARWHFAQIKLRPERYTLQTDFEYLVCNRGDLVRVTHDVPMWGSGSGRIKSVGVSSLNLTEPVLLESNKVYQIRVRLNDGSSLVYTLSNVEATDYYDYIETTTQISAAVLADNLFMLGEIGKETQELIVINIESSSNTSATLTLMDYSPEIYSADLSELLVFNANISGRSTQIIKQSITKSPNIISIISDSAISEEISNGIFQNTTIVSYSNETGLTDEARKVQLQVVLGNSEFEDTSPASTYITDKEVGSFTLHGLKTLTIYKFRARYMNSTGSIVGPWSETVYATVLGKTSNNYTVPTLILDLDRTYITAVPTNTLNKPSNFKTYEYRLYKDTGTEDFWELDTVSNNILVIQSLDVARFNLLDVSMPRISEAGITYRVACRSVDNTNNYSTESALGTIVIKTIQ
jgi:hypothetical protein